MAIGDITASGGITRSYRQDNAGAIKGDSYRQLGDSISGLASAIHGYNLSALSIEQLYDERVRASNNLELETQYTTYRAERAKGFEEYSRQYSDSPTGLTSSYESLTKKQDEDFLKRVGQYDPRFRQEYAARLAQDAARDRLKYFETELNLMDAKDKRIVRTEVDNLRIAIHNGEATLDEARLRAGTLIGSMGLPAADKAVLYEAAIAAIEGTDFTRQIERAQNDELPASYDFSGRDVVAPGLTAAQRAILNTIAFRESGGKYNVLNGGSTFDDYSKHPGRVGPGGTSTAAGRYQFTQGTWLAAKNAYEVAYHVEVPDFSPMWQDRVALFWAGQIYNRWTKSGLTFDQALNSGDEQALLSIKTTLGDPKTGNPLSKEWAALASDAMSGAEFIRLMTGENGIAGGGTGSSQVPDIWTSEQYSSLSYDERSKLALAASTAYDTKQRAQADELSKAVSTLKDQAYAYGFNNPSTETADVFMEQVRQTPGLTSHDIVKIEESVRSGIDAGQKKQTSIYGVTDKINSGSALGPNDQGAYNEWFSDRKQGVRDGDDGAWTDLTFAALQTGSLPTDAIDVLTAAVDDKDRSQRALEFLALLHKERPEMFEGKALPTGLKADAMFFERVAANTDPTTAATMLLSAKANALGKSQEVLDRESTKAFNDSITLTEIQKGFGIGYFSRTDTIELGKSSLLMLDARQAYTDGYRIYGNADLAKEYMNGVLGETWGMTGVGSAEKFSKYPIENYYPQFDMSDDNSFTSRTALTQMLDDQSRRSLTWVLQGDSVALDGLTATLVPDRQTEQDINSTGLPTYSVVVTDGRGMVHVLPERFGGESTRRVLQLLNERGVAGASKSMAFNAAITSASKIGLDARSAAFDGDVQAVEQLIEEAKLRAAEASAVADDQYKGLDDFNREFQMEIDRTVAASSIEDLPTVEEVKENVKDREDFAPSLLALQASMDAATAARKAYLAEPTYNREKFEEVGLLQVQAALMLNAALEEYNRLAEVIDMSGVQKPRELTNEEKFMIKSYLGNGTIIYDYKLEKLRAGRN